jgi:NADH-quinone oxidoreductase subunit L
LATLGIVIAWSFYKTENNKPQKMATGLSGLYRGAYHKFYIDEIYLFITKKVIFNLIGRPAAWVDRNIVDGFMNLLATITGKISLLIKGMQSGKLQNYASYFFVGVVGFVLIFIYMWT